jgi:hypothetical protein
MNDQSNTTVPAPEQKDAEAPKTFLKKPEQTAPVQQEAGEKNS